MGRSVARPLESTPVQTLDLRMAKGSIPLHRAENAGSLGPAADGVSLILETLADIGMSDKEACIHMEYDAPLFSKVKQGRARLPFDALWLLPDRFWIPFHRRIAVARGLTEESRAEIRAARIAELVRLILEV